MDKRRPLDLNGYKIISRQIKEKSSTDVKFRTIHFADKYLHDGYIKMKVSYLEIFISGELLPDIFKWGIKRFF